jgi:hypothetical protein
VTRVLLAAGLVVIGLAVGIASAGVHATWWGLPLALVTTAVTAFALPGGWTRRVPFVLGWAAAVSVLAVPTAEGDLVISGDVSGYALLGFGVMLVVAGFVTLPQPRTNVSREVPTS